VRKKKNHESTKGRKHEKRDLIGQSTYYTDFNQPALSFFRAFVLSCFRYGICLRCMVLGDGGSSRAHGPDRTSCAMAAMRGMDRLSFRLHVAGCCRVIISHASRVDSP
jgi:hypothetical protein